MITLKRILVPVDFGDASDAALAYGRALARSFGASIDVLHVVENLFSRAITTDGFAVISPEMQADLEASARSRLADLLIDNDDPRLDARPVILTSSSPAIEIVAYAKAHAVDLIIMGTHGRKPVARFFMGSVAESVVRTAPCPVLTVRHPEHEFVLPDALQAVATT